MNLVIVESPAKAKTIEKFLGSDYHVMSSFGHIRDLKTKDISIDFSDGGYKPIYEVPADKRKLVADLKKEVKNADKVYLASDEDREGEAIAWHLAEVLGLDKQTTSRIVFHEITKQAILDAIEKPRTIDLNLVDAQQARRVLDRIVGFELSPILWKKIKPALSAGRVQSVAVRLIVEREREIRNAKIENYYKATALFSTADGDTVKAELDTKFSTKQEALKFLEECKNAEYKVTDIQNKPAHRTPAAPFTTSTLQQEASRKLGFSVSQTMMIAQRLYESGKITYMRTDSVNLSSLAINTAKAEITATYGAEYSKPRNYTTKSKGAQEAHEAIRPTYLNVHEVSGGRQEAALYDLIYKRTIACQMADAEIERTIITITSGNKAYNFIATGETIKFDGFLKVYLEGNDDDSQNIDAEVLPSVSKGTLLKAGEIDCTERFTQLPPRYTEASLVKKMEELGIGRPSTYAPTISTILSREYVVKGDKEGTKRNYEMLKLKGDKITESVKSEMFGADKGKLIPTDTGMVVNDFLSEDFASILDYNFTADVEQTLDKVAEGKAKWEKTIDNFYKDFHKNIEKSLKQKAEHKVGERILGTDPKTGKPVSVKIGRFGVVAQIGSASDAEKPQFASLKKGQSIESVTLEEVLELFKLPRTLGEFEGKPVVAAIGRFGAYISHDGKFCSLPKGVDPLKVTLDEAITLINEKRNAEANKVFRTFNEDPSVQLLNGRYGIYLCKDKTNYKLPKGTEPEKLTYADCLKIMEEESAKSTGKTRFAHRKK
ncbi:MAG: type I DNA topoisomerase [Paludibacteraceae bacterium]|nr:type I DNA topoisomerase [Paludibacteraceae bacterium]